jgi:hypothetical protein
MTNEDLFDIWAPADVGWSAWVKPVLFAQQVISRTDMSSPDEWQNAAAAWAPESHENTAVVVDLPGRQALLAGLALAARGYRPVPLFNACCSHSAVVPMEPILDLIARAAPYLAGLFLPDDAPPAFLLDADRLRGTNTPRPGLFDNRWLVFPQDFPSANFLRSHAIDAVLLVQAPTDQPQSDLAHVLLRWQQAGLSLRVAAPAAGAAPQPLQVRRPRLFGWMWQRALAALGLRRNSAGGFGAIVPQPSSGSG